MSTIPDFFSEELRSAISDSRSAIEGLDEALNRVSADIKALESYLERVGPKAEFRWKMWDETDPAGYGDSWSLLLAPDEKTGRMRLLYEWSRTTCSVDGPDFLNKEARPLIETPFEIRKRVYERLPEFVLALGHHLAVDPKDDPLRLAPVASSEDELPF